MTRPAPRRNTVAVAVTLVAFSLGVTVAVLLADPAAALAPSSSSTTTAPAPLPGPTTTSTTGTTRTTRMTGTPAAAATAKSPADRYFVVNATVNAASDHERLGSSAFPNFAKGAVDNYYSLAHSHVDNSPFAEGTASPADTGPIGQTAAAGHAQQPQYANARWPGDPDKATYGSQGGPYAVATASEYRATAEATAAWNGLNGTNGSTELATPKGFDSRLRQVLADWKADWQSRLLPKAPTGPVRTPAPRIPAPTGTVTIPTATIPTPTATVTTPTAPLGGPPPTPPVGVPSPGVPSAAASRTASPSRSLAAANAAPKDGASLLASSTLVALDPKSDALVTSGESSLGRVSLGGGQIVIEKIHVAAAIENDGTPKTKVAVSVGAASIGGIPVTIDQDGVHVAGQSKGLPYEQASEALNTALKQAGIKLFVVTPEITTSSCDRPGAGTDTPSTTTTTTSEKSGTTTTSSSCDQASPTTTTTCDQTGTGTGTGTGTTTSPSPIAPPPATTSDRSGTTATTSSCDSTGTTTKATTTSSCGAKGPTTGTTTAGGQGGATDSSSSGGATVTATGVHVLFTQPVEQSGVPAQYAEHILGEVYIDSLAVPAGPIPKLDLSSSFSSCGSASSRRASTSGGASTPAGGSAAGGSTSFAGGSASSGSLSPAASGFGSTSQPGSSSGGTSLPAAFASALRKPLWLLLAYLLWQALVIGTGASLWNWGRGETS